MRPVAIDVKQKEIILAPIACIHWPVGEQDLLRSWVDAIRSRPNCYTILMGDSFDFARSHYRTHLRSYTDDSNSQEAIDAYVKEDVRRLAKILDPIKGRIWGSILGNHYHTFLDGINSEQYLCQLLGIKYLGVMGGLRLTIPANGNTRRTVKIFAHHHGGSRGARTTGGDVAGAMRNELAWDADVYLVAHTHRRYAFKESVMTLSEHGDPPKIVERTKVFARVGAMLKGFKEDNPSPFQPHRPSYAEEAAYRATDLGWVEITLKWRRKNGRASTLYYPDYQLSY